MSLALYPKQERGQLIQGHHKHPCTDSSVVLIAFSFSSCLAYGNPSACYLVAFRGPALPLRGNLPGLWNPDTSQTCCTRPAFAKICCVYQNYFGLSSTGALKLESLGVCLNPLQSSSHSSEQAGWDGFGHAGALLILLVCQRNASR